MNYFDLPHSTSIQQFVPKNSFDSFTNSKQKAMFANDIAKITWCNKLSKDTINLPYKEIQEIQIFNIELKEQKEIKNILEIIDKSIPYHIIFIVTFEDNVYFSTSSKHISPTNENKAIIDWTFTTQWFKKSENKYRLTLTKDLDTIFFNFCKQLSKKANKSIKNIADLIEYDSRIQSLTKEITLLKKKIATCRQYNKQVELNRKLKSLESVITKT